MGFFYVLKTIIKEISYIRLCTGECQALYKLSYWIVFCDVKPSLVLSVFLSYY